MDITGHYFINLLYLCEDDKKIISMRKFLGINRPVLGKEFKEDGYTSIVEHKTRTEIFFSDISNFKKNISPDLTCNILFSGITLNYRTNIILPFNLKMNDSLDVVIKKIGVAPKYHNTYFPKKTWLLKRDDGKDYLLHATFDEDDYSELICISLDTYDDNIELLQHHA